MKEITQEMLDSLLRAYRRLDERSDKLMNQAEEATRRGDKEECAKKGKKAEALVDQMIGMVDAVHCIGYDFVCQDGEQIIVEREYE